MEQRLESQRRFIPSSIKSGKLFRASRFAPYIDKGSFLVKTMTQNSFSYGVIATKKVGCAVERNYIKRRIRHAFINCTRALRSEPRVAVILIAKKDAGRVDFARLVEACSDVIKNIESR